MAREKSNRVGSDIRVPKNGTQSVDKEHEQDASPGKEDEVFSIDDTVALLIQLEPENIPELTQIKSDLEGRVGALSPADPLGAYLNDALKWLERLIQGLSTDPESDLNQVMISLDAARKMDHQLPDESFIAADSPMPECEPATAPDAPPADPGPAKITLPPDADSELIGEFVTESKDLLEKAEAALLLLETNPEDKDSVNTVFRTFHTIKGNSGFLGLTLIQEFAHFAESLLSRLRDGEIRFEGSYAELALRSTDVLKELTEGVQALLAGAEASHPRGYQAILTLLQNPEAAENRLEKPLKEKTSAPEKSGTAAMAAMENAGSAQPAQRRTSAPSDGESTLRVRTDRLDQLVDMVGELVIAQSLLSQDTMVHQIGNHDLLRKVTHSGKIVRKLQDLAMSMRMVPLKGCFQKVARLVRDLAHKSGKPIEFISEGDETEIDRNMVDILSDPLVHMVRNAIDHGIEPPEVRAALGKPQAGIVRLFAYHSGGNVVLELRDDGKGLDRDKIIAKAISKGLLDSEINLSDSEILQLIFQPGFSTADKITEISGRGVGMDVVRKNVEALHGRIDINSEPGKGCTFFVRLPLTLAITDGMLVKVGRERYIIPTVNIHLSFKPVATSLWTVAGQGEMVMLRGELMPLFRLHSLFGIDDAISDPTKGLLVVVGEGEKRCSLLVDQLIGQQQVVAKSLGYGLAKIPGIAGGAILGDGRVGLILDTSALVVRARQGVKSSNSLELSDVSAA